MLSDEKIKELAVRFGLMQFGSRDVVTQFTRAIEAECRLPQIDGLEEAVAMPYCEAAQYYETRPNRELYEKARDTFQAVWDAATAYLKASKGE